MDLNILDRTLAERAADELWTDLSNFQHEITDSERDAEYAAFVAAAIEPVEAVIREAIEKTIERAEWTVGMVIADEMCVDASEETHQWLKKALAAIRSLKQS